MPLADLVEEAAFAGLPRVVSFHFGLPAPDLLARVKGWGATVLSSATTVAEARWLEDHGADGIIAQGLEAGGHRGHFLPHARGDDPADPAALWAQAGSLALLPRVVDAVTLPVIAAGGICSAQGVAAARALGASAVQVGTAYLLCPEADTGALHRAALRAARDDPAAHPTALTNLYTGRPARGLVTRLMRELGPLNPAAPAFPLATAALAPLRAEAERRGSADFTPLVVRPEPVGLPRDRRRRADARTGRRLVDPPARTPTMKTFGAAAQGLRLERMQASPRWAGQGFRNLHPVLPGLRDASVDRPTLRDFLCGGERRTPGGALPLVDPRAAWQRAPASGLRATWLGHSTVLVEIDGLRVLDRPGVGAAGLAVAAGGPEALPSRAGGAEGAAADRPVDRLARPLRPPRPPDDQGTGQARGAVRDLARRRRPPRGLRGAGVTHHRAGLVGNPHPARRRAERDGGAVAAFLRARAEGPQCDAVVVDGDPLATPPGVLQRRHPGSPPSTRRSASASAPSTW